MIALTETPSHLKNKTIDDETVEEIVKIVKLVGDFFDWSPKTWYWLNTPNPMFGELVPMSLILAGRGHKVLRFVEGSIKENIE